MGSNRSGSKCEEVERIVNVNVLKGQVGVFTIKYYLIMNLFTKKSMFVQFKE